MRRFRAVRARPASPVLIFAALVGSGFVPACGGAADGGAGGSEGAGAAGEAAKAVARVNEVDITEKMVEQAIGLFQAQSPPGTAEPSPGQQIALRREVIEALINQELFVQNARQEGIVASSEEVERRMQTLEGRYGSAEAMQKALQEAGLDAERIRRLLERNLQIDAFLQKHVRSQIQVTDAEIEAYFRAHPEEMNRPEGVRASHILVLAEEGKASPEERQGARKKAEGLRARVRKGEDFAALARENSDDGSASRGGDLGYFPRGQMTPNFERAAFALKAGQMSGVVETPFGYHIIKVTDRRPARSFQLAEVRDALRRRLQAEHTDKRSQQFVESLRKDAKIERF